MTLSTHIMPSPVGNLLVAVNAAGALVRVAFVDEDPPDGLARHRDDDRCVGVVDQLTSYFDGSRRDFDIALAPAGTEFQLRVWEAVRQVPYGVTSSYGEVAQRLGSPGASRAVGAANGANPIAIVIPCHRILGADGSLTGYGGGLEKKAALLEMEGALPGGGFQRSLLG